MSFPSKTQWEITFKQKDSFFKDTLQRRLPDLEKAALKVCGQKIKFTFKVVQNKTVFTPAGSALEKKDEAAYTQKPAQGKSNNISSITQAAETSCQEQDFISSEEAFVQGDFSSFAANGENEEPVAEKLKDAGPKTRELLDIFDGDIVG